MNQKNKPLYNSRLLFVYVQLLAERYPDILIEDVMEYAGIEYYEIRDEGHWFTQGQTDLFVEKIVQLTGNENIAREAGRLAASPGTLGAMRQYLFGLVGPIKAFQLIKKGSEKMTRSSVYRSKQIGTGKVEVTVIPHEGIKERSYQCENRLGFFEAMVEGFNLARPQIEHPECLFNGGNCCRYIVSWKPSLFSFFVTLRNAYLIAATVALIVGLSAFPDPKIILISFLSFLVGGLSLALIAETSRSKDLSRSVTTLWDGSERSMDLIASNARNIQLVHKIGDALANKRSTEEVLLRVSRIMEDGLDFDCGAILLVNEDKTHLQARSVYGYPDENTSMLLGASFNLDNPESEGPFVQSYHQKSPVVVTSQEQLKGKLSERSQGLIDKLNVDSFIVCPIMVGEDVLGILAVNNQTSKKPLIKNDVSLLQGVAPVIGVALQNANLIEELQTSFEKTMETLASSIDARDHLTSGHSKIVTEYSAALAEEMGLPEDYVHMLRLAGLLHDYGKISIPDEILKKAGPLTKDEREIINTHPVHTQKILSQVPFRGIHKQIPEITGAHHERWDGTGYPLGLKGEDIPLGARILAVADFFEAITAKRHYRDPMPIIAAVALLRESSGSHFDPKVVAAFINYLEKNNFSLIHSHPSLSLPEIHLAARVRRKAPRSDYFTQLSIRSGQFTLTGHMLNIGMRGAFISSSDTVKLGQSLVVTFALPKTSRFKGINAVVVWVNDENQSSSNNHPQGFAVQFENVDSEVQNEISFWVRKQFSAVTSSSPNANADFI